jgi:hypothetical protein
MKRLAVRAAVFTSVFGGMILAASEAASARLATNHCEPIVRVD